MPTPHANQLEIRLKRLIKMGGPISIADYMALCLSDPQNGYYMGKDPFGKGGDFTTAPEISQMFGELIAIWMHNLWQQQDSPTPFHLVELGPGRGTLMRDMINTLTQQAGTSQALHCHLVEISPTLIDRQKQSLKAFQQNGAIKIEWHESINTLPEDGPLFIIANEFFDALPIHQWIMHQGKWHERVIGVNEESKLAFGLGPVRELTDSSDSPTGANSNPPDGTIWEKSPLADAIMADLTRRCAQQGGAGLFIDYGYTNPAFGDTFQAVRNHSYQNPLLDPGRQDLTSHVNFSQLANIARQENTTSAKHALSIPDPITQADFLLAMGLLERAGQLGTGKSHEEQEAIRDAVERLAAPDQMGTLFKLLALFPTSTKAPVFA